MVNKIYIVIPAYNESDNIFNLVKNCKKYGRVIVVDDASTDKTGELASDAGAIVIRHALNTNVKQSIIDGFEKALEYECDYIIQMDAGFSHDPDDIPNLLKPLKENYDMTIGSRLVKKGKFINHSNSRILLTIIGSTLYRFGCSMNFKDLTSGFKGYKSDTLYTLRELGVFENLYSKATMHPEFTYEVFKRGFKILEVPITYRSSKSYNINFRSIIEVNKTLFKLLLNKFFCRS